MKNIGKKTKKRMKFLRKKKEFFSEEGILTIEAALAMGVFLIAFLSWILILQLIKIQAITQESLDQTVLSYSDRISFNEFLGKEMPGMKEFFKEKKIVEKQGLKDLDFNALLQETLEISDVNAIYLDYIYGGKRESWKADPWNKWIGASQIQKEINNEKGSLTLKLNYSLKLPGVLSSLGPIDISQNSTAGLWLFEKIDSSLEENEREDSLWDHSPFKRGEIFVQKMKEKSLAKLVIPGQVFDYISVEDSPTAIYSMNVFSPSYSRGEGLDSDQYQLKEKEITNKISSYVRKVKKAQLDYPILQMEDGSMEAISGKNLHILMIFPEEAKAFEKQLILLCQEIENAEGVSINFHFEDKALQAKEGD